MRAATGNIKQKKVYLLTAVYTFTQKDYFNFIQMKIENINLKEHFSCRFYYSAIHPLQCILDLICVLKAHWEKLLGIDLKA